MILSILAMTQHVPVQGVQVTDRLADQDDFRGCQPEPEDGHVLRGVKQFLEEVLSVGCVIVVVPEKRHCRWSVDERSRSDLGWWSRRRRNYENMNVETRSGSQNNISLIIIVINLLFFVVLLAYQFSSSLREFVINRTDVNDKSPARRWRRAFAEHGGGTNVASMKPGKRPIRGDG